MSFNFVEHNLYRSCLTLFGPRLNFSRQFLAELESGGLKSAYRRKALETHPDRTALNGGADLRLSAKKFMAVREAYENLAGYLKARRGNDFYTPENIYSPPVRRQPPSVDRLYDGPLPFRRLIFGHFLYYSGVASWRMIGQALIWQRRQRPLFGELVLSLRLLTLEEVSLIIREAAGKELFGAAAVELGLLNKTQVDELVARQKSMQKKIGEYFVAEGLFTPEELQDWLNLCQSHNALF